MAISDNIDLMEIDNNNRKGFPYEDLLLRKLS